MFWWNTSHWLDDPTSAAFHPSAFNLAPVILPVHGELPSWSECGAF
jgi:hypothetical protein